jgi:hypothetical protein
MDVTTWRSGNTFGVRVGVANRDKYFDRSWPLIEVEMDGEIHRFGLTAGFWHKCPEFRDKGQPIIRNWLKRHKSVHWARGEPPCMSLIPLKDNHFRLVA